MRTRATNSRICWDQVNPDLTVKPVALQEPAEPEDDNLFDKDDFEALKTQTSTR